MGVSEQHTVASPAFPHGVPRAGPSLRERGAWGRSGRRRRDPERLLRHGTRERSPLRRRARRGAEAGGEGRTGAVGAGPGPAPAPLRLPHALRCATHRRGKMAAAESSDSDEEDLVSYGTALQPLQEGKGTAGSSPAPPRYLRYALRRAARPEAPASPGGPGPARRCCGPHCGLRLGNAVARGPRADPPPPSPAAVGRRGCLGSGPGRGAWGRPAGCRHGKVSRPSGRCRRLPRVVPAPCWGRLRAVCPAALSPALRSRVQASQLTRVPLYCRDRAALVLRLEQLRVLGLCRLIHRNTVKESANARSRYLLCFVSVLDTRDVV